jgi:hypothetical protein
MPCESKGGVCHRIGLIQKDRFGHQASRFGQALTREAANTTVGRTVLSQASN